MTDIPPEKLVADYHRGRVTGHELVRRLIEAAIQVPPEELLPLVPAELLDDVRQCGLDPPETPEAAPRIFYLATVVGAAEALDWNAWQREQQAKYYDGVWRWHRFLIEQAR